jgi:hypothetical protein
MWVAGALTNSLRSTASSWTASRPYHPASRGSPTPCFSSGAALSAVLSCVSTSVAPLRKRQLPSVPSASLSSPTTTTKSQRGAASVVPTFLPDPDSAGDAGRDPEVTTLLVELIVCLANCASKDRVKEPAQFERVLSLVQQLQPWLL